jgi:hypothetical protein
MASKNEKKFWSALAQPKSIFWMIRGMIFLSFVLWMLLSGEPDRWMGLLFAIFVVYSLTILILTERVGWPGEKLYFITSIMDVALITLATWMTIDKQSGFCFLYFLVVPFGTYVAGLVPGLSLAFVSSIFHLTIKAQYPETLSVNSALIETLILWALAITVGVAVKDVKSSRSKLLRMFDILNQRTSELEKSQPPEPWWKSLT